MIETLEQKDLDAAVAVAIGWRRYDWADDAEDWDWRAPPTKDDEIGELMAGADWSPSTDWACGGWIIEESHIYIAHVGIDTARQWEAIAFAKYGHEGPEGEHIAYGATALIAAMRAYVLAKTPNDRAKGPAACGRSRLSEGLGGGLMNTRT